MKDNHTPGPIKTGMMPKMLSVEGDQLSSELWGEEYIPILTDSGTRIVARVAIESDNPQRSIDTAYLLSHAYASYDKHCGNRAVECAESDLLGECLDGLVEIRKTLADWQIPWSPREKAVDEIAKAILAKAKEEL